MYCFITYSDEKFITQRDYAVKMAKKYGGFDVSIGYKPDDIELNFYNKNLNVFRAKKGGGYWLWKPYFIYVALEKLLNNGDYLFYGDAGSFFINNVQPLIGALSRTDQDIMGFELPLLEKQWTKKELFINMDCNEISYSESNHLLASFMLIKKTPFSLRFFEEYLSYASEEINITDKFDDSVEQDQYFIEHRYDQSIFSLLYKKYKLKPFKDPSQFGKYPLGYSGIHSKGYSDINIFEPAKIYKLNNRLFRFYKYNDNYDQILLHYRRGSPIVSLIKHRIKEIQYTLKLNRKIIYD